MTGRKLERNFKPNLLCIAPPYGNRAPAGTAYLLGYLKAKGCREFDFLDLRLGASFDFTPSFRTTGTFGESYVMDVPDLPLVLQLIEAFDSGSSLIPERTPLFDRYCLERGISPHYLQSYLACLNRYFEAAFAQIPRIDFIGFSVWTPNYLATLIAAAHLKRRPKPPVIVAGGPQVTASQASAGLGLRSGLFDVVALSEGEETLYELYSEFARSGGLSPGVPGTAYLDPASGQIQRSDRKLLKLDSLPLPSFEEMPLLAYQTDETCRAVPFQLSRGCTDKCSFCSEWVFWRSFRPDTPDHAAGQIKELQKRYGVDFIEFSDSLLNGHHKRLVAFAEQLLSASVKIGWTSFMRAQMDAETAKLIARSGCTGVFIGIESFSDEALKLMNKRRTEAENIQAVRAFIEAGIHVTAGFIPGFPGDSRRGFLHSVEVLRELQDRYPGRLELHEEPFTVMANAPIYYKLEEMGLSPKPWADEYLDIAPRYRDLSSGVLCEVEGDAQGLERMGRMKIVGAVKSDVPVKGSFDEGIDEALPVHMFEFQHVYGGWYLAQKKSAAGHRYCLLVNEEECDELLELQDIHFPLEDLTHPEVAAKLESIESAHLVPPSRHAPRIVRALYRGNGADGCTYAVSPLVVARNMGWRHKDRALIFDTVTGHSYRRRAADASLIASLLKRPRTINQLWDHVRTRGLYDDRERLRKTIHELKENGILVVCDVEEPQHPQPLTTVRASLPVIQMS